MTEGGREKVERGKGKEVEAIRDKEGGGSRRREKREVMKNGKIGGENGRWEEGEREDRREKLRESGKEER